MIFKDPVISRSLQVPPKRFSQESDSRAGLSATAGINTSFANNGSATEFFNTSTAGGATINNNYGGAGNYSTTSFRQLDSGNGTFNGDTSGGGFVFFYNNSTAGNGTFIINGGTVSGAGASSDAVSAPPSKG